MTSPMFALALAPSSATSAVAEPLTDSMALAVSYGSTLYSTLPRSPVAGWACPSLAKLYLVTVPNVVTASDGAADSEPMAVSRIR